MTVRTLGRLMTVDDFNNLIIAHQGDKVVRFNLETYLYNVKNLKMGIQDVVLDVEGQDMVSSILDVKEEEQNVLESEWYQKIKSKSYSGAFSKGIAITQNDVKVKLIAYSKRYYSSGESSHCNEKEERI